jgi:hypothetical protein
MECNSRLEARLGKTRQEARQFKATKGKARAKERKGNTKH